MNNWDSSCTRISRDRILALAECILFLAIFLVSAWYLEIIQDTETYFFCSKLIMILLGAIGIFLHKKPEEYGLVPKNLRFSTKWSIYILLLYIGISYITILVGILLGIANLRVDFDILVVILLWYFAGFTEELFFRGFIQSRLNEVFTRKYKGILGVEFEWTQGTLITAIFFFGLPHLFVSINPFTGRAEFSLITFATACIFAPFLGVIFGIIREKTGGIIITATLHAMINFVASSIGRIAGIMLSSIALALAFFIFFEFVFEKILKSEI